MLFLRKAGEIMATIRTAIQIQDGMSPAFRSMTKVMNIVLSSFESIQKVSHTAIDTASIQTARAEMSKAEVTFNQVEQEIKEANEAQKKFNSSMGSGGGIANGLKSKIMGIAATVGVALGTKQILGLSDEMTSTTARLNLMNDGLQSTAELQEMIFQSAQRSRTSYMDTAATVSKLGILAKDAFSSNDEMIAFSELMNKQFKIGGASIQEQTSAMYQLTQAMASGKLQGDEFRSIMENAPLLAQSIAESLGMSVGELRSMSSEGLITADVIKNAMFSSADETNAKFKELPITFAEVWTDIKNKLIATFQPILEIIASGAQWISDNWSALIPVFAGVAGSILAIVVAMTAWKIITWLQTIAQLGLNAALMASGIGAILIVIGSIIAGIVKWIQSVGGIKVAWLIVVQSILSAWDFLKLSFFIGIYWVLDLWDKMKLGIMKAVVGITNFMGDMKAGVLGILENMVNGAIGIINDFIGLLNKIPGVEIGLIDNVTFGTEAKLKNEAEKQAKNAALKNYENHINEGIAARGDKITQMGRDALNAAVTRQAEIDAARTGASTRSRTDNVNVERDKMLGGIEDDTSSINDSMESSEEDLKYLRDIAEQETVNRFTTAEIKVDMPVSASIASNMDLDGVVSYLEEKVYETMEVAAEGVHE